MLQVDPIQSYLILKIGPPPVLKAGSSGIYLNKKAKLVTNSVYTKESKSQNFKKTIRLTGID
jgi:hypothetical protein